jgi:hypothetical protein
MTGLAAVKKIRSETLIEPDGERVHIAVLQAARGALMPVVR